MKIYTNGCSFTYGDELSNPLECSWPVILAKKLGADVYNDAVSGGTNYRTLYQTIKNTKHNYDLYVIAWTDYSRFTFYNSSNNFEINLNSQLKNDILDSNSEFKDWSKKFYIYFYNELYAFKIWLQQIIQLQAILSDRSYLMINTFPNNLLFWTETKENFINSIKHLINFDQMDDQQIFAEYDEINYYINNIKLSKYFQWNRFYIKNLCNSFPIGKNGHILEQGHDHLANLLYNHICLK